MHHAGTSSFAIGACLALLATAANAQPYEDHPWPTYMRTNNRQGNVPWSGPKTPTIARVLDVETSGAIGAARNTPLLDREGYLIVPLYRSLARVDPRDGRILWEHGPFDQCKGPVLTGERVLWGHPLDMVHCLDRHTGQVLWEHPTDSHSNKPLLSDGAFVYYITRSLTGGLYCDRVSDGSNVWFWPASRGTECAPSIDDVGLVFAGDFTRRTYALDRFTAAERWRFTMGGTNKDHCIFFDDGADGRVYSYGSNSVHCLHRRTGEEIWKFDLGATFEGAYCLDPGGGLYAGTAIGEGSMLFAIGPDGEEMWRVPIDLQMLSPPVVDVDGTVYLCAGRNSSEIGAVFAINPDGTLLWRKDMPKRVWHSPMIAPDGAMYIQCDDRLLYVFKDPCAADCDGNGRLDIRDFFCFQALFAQRDGRADCDTSGTWDIRDFFCFQRAFAEGCP